MEKSNFDTNTTWRCDVCKKEFNTIKEAEKCESWHESVKQRNVNYKQAKVERKPLLARYGQYPNGDIRLLELQLVLDLILDFNEKDKSESFRYNALSVFGKHQIFLPDPKDSLYRYISFIEAVQAGWCPFFAPSYQKEFPLSIREQIADAFLALPKNKQEEFLIAQETFSKGQSEY